MFSDAIQRGAAQFLRELEHGPSTASPRLVPRAKLCRLAGLEHSDPRAVVLRALIEEFGGEAVSSALHHRLIELGSWNDAKSGQSIRQILVELEDCKALTLEDAQGADVIARIEPTGINLAYGCCQKNLA